MEVILFNNRDKLTHCNDIGIDCLAAKELYTFLINIRLAGREACCDNAAVAKSIVVGLHGAFTATEGVSQELLCKFNLLAVTGDIQGRTAVCCIAFFSAFNRGQSGQSPFAAVGCNLGDGWDDPVAVHNAGYLIAHDGLVGILRPAVCKDNGSVICALYDHFNDLLERLIVDEVGFAILPLGEAFGLHHHVGEVIAGVIHGKHCHTGLVFYIFCNLKPTIPGDSGYISKGVAALLKNVGTVCKNGRAVINRCTIMYTVNGAVAQLLSAEVGPVNVCTFKALPAIGVVADESLNVMILEEHDIRQGADISGRAGKRYSLLNVRGAGLKNDFQFEIRVYFLECSFGGLQGRNVEVCIPGICRQGVVIVCKSCNGEECCTHCKNDHEGKNLFHVKILLKIFSLSDNLIIAQ